jgi:hypothetical protein
MLLGPHDSKSEGLTVASFGNLDLYRRTCALSINGHVNIMQFYQLDLCEILGTSI